MVYGAFLIDVIWFLIIIIILLWLHLYYYTRPVGHSGAADKVSFIILLLTSSSVELVNFLFNPQHFPHTCLQSPSLYYQKLFFSFWKYQRLKNRKFQNIHNICMICVKYFQKNYWKFHRLYFPFYQSLTNRQPICDFISYSLYNFKYV